MNVALRDVVSLQKGLSYASAHFASDGVALLSLGCMDSSGNFQAKGVKWYSGPFQSRHELSPGDLALALTDLTQTGHVLGQPLRVPAFTDRKIIGSLHLARVDVQDPTRIDRGYLFYRLRAPDYRWWVSGAATGSTVRMLRTKDVLDFRVDLPPVEEQRVIAGALGALDDKIELNRRMNQTLGALAIAHFDQLYWRSPDRSTWDREPLGEHLEVVRGLSYTGAGLTEAGIPLHNLNSIYEGGGYKRDGLKRYSGDFKDRHLASVGDVIVANTEQGFDSLLIAFPAIVPARFGDSGLFSHHLYRVRPRPSSPLTSRLIYLLLLEGPLRAEVAGYANGTTVNMLPIDALQKPLVRVPPPEVVAQIDGLVAPLFARAEAAEDESETLAELRDALLPKLISGELRVRDGQAAVESA